MDNSIILTCIVPFAPKGFTRDWGLACNYLEQTVSSLLNSENPRIAVVVVGHDYPGDFLNIDPRVRFLESNQPAPPQKLEKDPILAIKDWLAKIRCGWEYAKQYFPSDYVMKMDADDFLSRKVVSFIANGVSCPGFRITDGWVWNTGSRFSIQKTESFNILCGSSVIVRSDLADREFDPELVCNPVPSPAALAHHAIKPSLLTNEFHPFFEKAMALNGYKVVDIPFRAGVYRVGNVNSHSRRTWRIHSIRFALGQIRRLRFLTPALRKEFLI